MRVAIELSGVVAAQGKVQVRFSYFLRPNEARYSEHVVDGQEVPFHNHFVYIDPSVTDEQLMTLGRYWGRQAYRKWRDGERIVLGHDAITGKAPEIQWKPENHSQAVARMAQLHSAKPPDAEEIV